MTTKLGVTVALDPDTNVVTIRPDGRLTPQNLQHLVAVFHRAQQLLPGFVVHIDATALRTTPGYHVQHPDFARSTAAAGFPDGATWRQGTGCMSGLAGPSRLARTFLMFTGCPDKTETEPAAIRRVTGDKRHNPVFGANAGSSGDNPGIE